MRGKSQVVVGRNPGQTRGFTKVSRLGGVDCNPPDDSKTEGFRWYSVTPGTPDCNGREQGGMSTPGPMHPLGSHVPPVTDGLSFTLVPGPTPATRSVPRDP